MIRKEKNGIVGYASTLLEKAGVNHLFFTRFGGVSQGVFESLNMSTARKDENGLPDSPVNVAENYRRALSFFGISPENACGAKQVHGNTVRTVFPLDAGKGIALHRNTMPDGDGLILRKGTDGIKAVCVKTADCVPILLADTVTGDVAAVHAGWRGTVTDIASLAAQKLSDGHPEHVVAAIGPCIGACCYEVGEEVYTAMKRLLAYKQPSANADALFRVESCCSLGGKRTFDLKKANALLLEISGVRPQNIDVCSFCTCCYTENGARPFFSHRAQKTHSGTFLSAVCV